MTEPQFRKNLLHWYKKNKRRLPWRETRDPYKIWISEVMLQQTTVNTVIPYYKRWVAAFPDVKKAARQPLSRLLKVWQGLGYYGRVRNIHKSAKIMCAEFGCRVPDDMSILRKLPGFGPYTASAVLSIAFGQRHPLIDANVRRVAMRLLALRGPADTKKDKEIFCFLDKHLPGREPGAFNQALMELGALVCKPQSPLCLLCPVRRTCLAYKKGLQDVIPLVLRRVIRKGEAACGLIEHKNRYFIQKRPESGLFAGLWEFPGGKREKGESLEETLRRELKEEVGVCVVRAKYLTSIRHAYTDFRITLHAWRCKVRPLPRVDQDHMWVSLKEFEKYPMPTATAKIIEKLSAL